jgi:lipooligosaccharide transport system permease protein
MTAPAAPMRAPATPRGLWAHPALRELEHDLLVFRRDWRNYLVSGLSQPFLYLLSMGVGLGLYVNRNGGLPDGVPYLVYVAPALLATQAMMAGAAEGAWPIMSKILWTKTYQAAMNTPLGVLDLMFGDLLWIGLRLTLLSCLFFVPIVVLGAVVSPLAVLAIPVAILTGLAFAAPIMAFTATQRDGNGFNMLFRFGITPLFLFSGTFFPIEKLPLFMQPLAWLTPLYHGVALAREFSLGHVDPVADLVHLGFLAAVLAAGVAAARITFRRRLSV